MKNNCLLLFLFVFVSLISCKKQNPFVRQEQVDDYIVTHFDIPEQQSVQAPLKLSELVKNARMVPLETSKECLIGSYAKYYIGNSFILVFQEENILLFDIEGHFVRTIAHQGKAPEEFLQVKDFCVDEDNQLLYVIDNWTKHPMKSYHLTDSTYFKPIKTMEAVNNAIECLDNGNLFMAPNPFGDVKYYCYQQTPEGELRENWPYHSNRKERPIVKQLIYRANEELRYLSSEIMLSDDTVFTVLPQRLQPTWIFHCSDNKHYNVLGETPQYLFFKFSILESTDQSETTNGAKVVALDYDSHSFYYDKKDGGLVSIEGVLDDCFSGKVWSLEYKTEAWIQNGNKLCINMPAMVLLREAEKKADNGVEVKFPEAWKKMMAEFTEEDNPILIFGDLK